MQRQVEDIFAAIKLYRDQVKSDAELQKFYEGMLSDDKVAIQLNPKLYYNYFTVALFSALLQKHTEAKQSLEKGIALLPPDAIATFEQWGDYFLQNKCFDLAYITFSKPFSKILANFKSHRTVPDQVILKMSYPLLFKAGRVALDMGKPAEAITCLDLASHCSETPFIKELIDDLKESSVAGAEAAANMVKDFGQMYNVEVYLYLGIAYLNQDNLDSANQYFHVTKNCRFAERFLLNNQKNMHVLSTLTSIKLQADLYFAIIEPGHRQDFSLSPHRELLLKYPDSQVSARATIAYFKYLAMPENPSERIDGLRTVMHNQQAELNIRLMAGVALSYIDTNQQADFLALFEQTKSTIDLSNIDIETACVWAIAQRAIHQFKPISSENIFANVITPHLLLPRAIPLYLRAAFLEVLLDKNYWPKKPLTYAETYDLATLKAQYVEFVECSMITTGVDADTLFNLAIQAICPSTTIGQIINIAQHYSTSLTSGSKAKFINYLAKNLRSDVSDLTPSTREALRTTLENDPYFLYPIQKKYPELYTMLMDCGVEEKLNYTPLDVIDPREYKFSDAQVLREAKECRHVDAANQLRGNISLQYFPLVLENADVFFECQAYRLALMAYEYVLTTRLSLSSRQLVNAGRAAMKLGKFNRAREIFEALNLTTLPEIYNDAAEKAKQAAIDKAHLRSPQGFYKVYKNIYKVDHSKSAALFAKAKQVVNSDDKLFYLALVDLNEGKEPLRTVSALKFYCLSYEDLRLSGVTSSGLRAMEIEAWMQLGIAEMFLRPLERKNLEAAVEHFAKLFEIHGVGVKSLARIHILRAKVFKMLNRKEDALKELLIVWNDPRADTINKLLCGVQLTRLDNKFITPLQELLTNSTENNYLNPHDNCILAMAYSAVGNAEAVRSLLKFSNIAPQVLLPYELPLYLRNEHLKLLLRYNNNLPKILEHPDYTELSAIKNYYVERVVKHNDVNVGFQALCENTLIGKLIKIARGYIKGTSLYAGSNKQILIALDKYLSTGVNVKFSPETRAALIIEILNNPSFKSTLQAYPAVDNLITQCIEQEMEQPAIPRPGRISIFSQANAKAAEPSSEPKVASPRLRPTGTDDDL